MPPSERRVCGRAAVAGASLALGLAIALLPRAASARDCLEGISDANAKKLFDALAKGRQPDGCELDDVMTDKSFIQIRWTKDGQVLDPVLVAPSSCVGAPAVRGPVLSMMAPPFVSDDCGKEIGALGSLIQTDAFGILVPLVGPTKVPDRATVRLWARIEHHAPLIGGGLALASTGIGAFLWVRRRRSRPQPVKPPKAPEGV